MKNGVCCVAVAALIGLVSCSATAQAVAESARPVASASAPRAWALRLPALDRVVFRGGLERDAKGLDMAPMLYPAPNAATLLVAVMAHGLASAGVQERERVALQKEADTVLVPLEPVLGTYTHRRLFADGMRHDWGAADARLLEPTETASDRWVIESTPVFTMTQDRRAIVLDNALRVFAPGAAAPATAQTVRVVSAPLAMATTPQTAEPAASAASAPLPGPAASAAASATDAQAALPLWLDADGRRLTQTSAALYAESLRIIVAELDAAAGESPPPARTFRYPEGGRERIERAQLVRERCDRRLIRSLRGWLISVPSARELAPTCQAPA